jgi:hypothetical protein
VSGDDFELNFGLTSRCVRCNADRDPEGQRILSSDTESGSTYMVRAEKPCDCGEDRVKVEFSIGGDDSEEEESEQEAR